MKARHASVLVILSILACVLLGPVRYTAGDSHLTLLSAEAFAHHGSFALDEYFENTGKEKNYRLRKINHHIFYNFPLGTALTTSPIVALANGLGFGMIHYEDYLQRILAGVSIILCYLLMLKIGKRFLPETQAKLISCVFVFGTPIMSTMGSALWSHNLAMVMSLCALELSFKLCFDNNRAFIIGIPISLFMAYFDRPTLSILSPFLIAFIFSYRKKEAVIISLILMFLIFLFMLYCTIAFHQFLPPYYLASRLETHTFLEGLIGNTFSASRGIFIFCPFLFFMLLCNGFKKMHWVKNSWLFIAVAWPIAHLLSVANFPMWWGGYGFGPRLMTDCLPGLFILTVAAWPIRMGWAAYLLVISILFSIFVNTYQARFNINASLSWNQKYQVDKKYMFDYSIAQGLYPK